MGAITKEGSADRYHRIPAGFDKIERYCGAEFEEEAGVTTAAGFAQYSLEFDFDADVPAESEVAAVCALETGAATDDDEDDEEGDLS